MVIIPKNATKTLPIVTYATKIRTILRGLIQGPNFPFLSQRFLIGTHQMRKLHPKLRWITALNRMAVAIQPGHIIGVSVNLQLSLAFKPLVGGV